MRFFINLTATILVLAILTLIGLLTCKMLGFYELTWGQSLFPLVVIIVFGLINKWLNKIDEIRTIRELEKSFLGGIFVDEYKKRRF